jgi:hypothetical protein
LPSLAPSQDIIEIGKRGARKEKGNNNEPILPFVSKIPLCVPQPKDLLHTMDPSEERLREVLATGFDLWSLIDTAVAVAARDYPTDLRLRREGIVQSLYSLTPCRNCDPNLSNLVNGHGLGSTRTNGDGSVVTLANGHGTGVNPGYHIEASQLAASPTPSPEPELRHTEREDEDGTEISIRDLISIKEFLEDPDQRVLFLMLHCSIEVTYWFQVF